LRIDWPIGHLGVEEIGCYSTWLESRVPYSVGLPTVAEWQWFAAGDNQGTKFPWGDDPDDGQEALFGVPVDPVDEFPGIRYEQGGRFVSGVRVGLFPPNSWGLHDILGNLREISSDRIDGETFASQNPDSRFVQSTKEFDRQVIVGNSRYDEYWKDFGLFRQNTVLIVDGQFSTNSAVRLVLIEKES
jgi:formylglycine-generating enzyme required for sulfatase activity